jgi:hypothetical protein
MPIGWCMAIQENRALLLAITVRAFLVGMSNTHFYNM